MKLLKYLPITALAALMPLSAQAILIGFETTEGYVAGSVAGQPTTGTQWTVTGGGVGNVVATGGNPTQRLSLTHDGTAGDNFQSARFLPSNADLGVAGFPETINYSFDLRLDSYDGTTNTNYGTVSLLRDSTSANTGRALRIGFNFNGTVQITSTTFAGGTLTLSGANAPFTNSTGYVTFSGQANFSTNMTTLSINGTSVNSGNSFAFANQTGTGSDSYGNFEASLSNVAGTYSLDNISLEAVPEPGTALLLIGGLGVLLGIRRLR